MHSKNTRLKKLVLIFALSTLHFSAFANICTPYTKQKPDILGPNAGKQVQKAFELYSANDLSGTIVILKQINGSNAYEKAYVNRFIGVMYALMTDKEAMKQSLPYLKQATQIKVLNPSDHIESVKLIADLQMQNTNYQDALNYYAKWQSLKVNLKQHYDKLSLLRKLKALKMMMLKS